MTDKIKNLISIAENIDIKNLNLKIINKNIDILTDLYKDLKSINNGLNINSSTNPYIKLNESDPNHELVLKYVESYLSIADSKKLSEVVKNFNKVIMMSYQNVNFFYIYNSDEQLEKDLDLIYLMLRITFILSQYVNPNDDITRDIVWIPIDTYRDFKYDIVNEQNLKSSQNKYEAFTVSGVTSGSNPRYTLISRYEEVVKLLLHELIHNFHLDGANYHNKLKSVINKFMKIKNNSNSKIKNYNYEYSIYESYTELLGTYLNLLFEDLDLDEKKLKEKLLGQIGAELIYSYNTIANLARLNNHESYTDFINSKSFLGKICIYEYYFVKALLYNNFVLEFPKDENEFVNMYTQINNIINKASEDKLLEDIFSVSRVQTNFRYTVN